MTAAAPVLTHPSDNDIQRRIINEISTNNEIKNIPKFCLNCNLITNNLVIDETYFEHMKQLIHFLINQINDNNISKYNKLLLLETLANLIKSVYPKCQKSTELFDICTNEFTFCLLNILTDNSNLAESAGLILYGVLQRKHSHLHREIRSITHLIDDSNYLVAASDNNLEYVDVVGDVLCTKLSQLLHQAKVNQLLLPLITELVIFSSKKKSTDAYLVSGDGHAQILESLLLRGCEGSEALMSAQCILSLLYNSQNKAINSELLAYAASRVFLKELFYLDNNSSHSNIQIDLDMENFAVNAASLLICLRGIPIYQRADPLSRLIRFLPCLPRVVECNSPIYSSNIRPARAGLIVEIAALLLVEGNHTKRYDALNYLVSDRILIDLIREEGTGLESNSGEGLGADIVSIFSSFSWMIGAMMDDKRLQPSDTTILDWMKSCILFLHAFSPCLLWCSYESYDITRVCEFEASFDSYLGLFSYMLDSMGMLSFEGMNPASPNFLKLENKQSFKIARRDLQDFCDLILTEYVENISIRSLKLKCLAILSYAWAARLLDDVLIEDYREVQKIFVDKLILNIRHELLRVFSESCDKSKVLEESYMLCLSSLERLTFSLIRCRQQLHDQNNANESRLTVEEMVSDIIKLLQNQELDEILIDINKFEAVDTIFQECKVVLRRIHQQIRTPQPMELSLVSFRSLFQECPPFGQHYFSIHAKQADLPLPKTLFQQKDGIFPTDTRFNVGNDKDDEDLIRMDVCLLWESIKSSIVSRLVVASDGNDGNHCLGATEVCSIKGGNSIAPRIHDVRGEGNTGQMMDLISSSPRKAKRLTGSSDPMTILLSFESRAIALNDGEIMSELLVMITLYNAVGPHLEQGVEITLQYDKGTNNRLIDDDEQIQKKSVSTTNAIASGKHFSWEVPLKHSLHGYTLSLNVSLPSNELDQTENRSIDPENHQDNDNNSVAESLREIVDDCDISLTFGPICVSPWFSLHPDAFVFYDNNKNSTVSHFWFLWDKMEANSSQSKVEFVGLTNSTYDGFKTTTARVVLEKPIHTMRNVDYQACGWAFQSWDDGSRLLCLLAIDDDRTGVAIIEVRSDNRDFLSSILSSDDFVQVLTEGHWAACTITDEILGNMKS